MEAKISISKSVKNRIDTFKEGYIFSYLDFEEASKNKEAIIKSLNRLEYSGKLYRHAKGKYYKPIKEDNKTLYPNPYEIIKDLLEKNGKPIGYITGINVFNKQVLTNPISNIIQIGRNTYKPKLLRYTYKIEFVLQRNEITNDNIVILQVLDCLKMFKGLSVINKDNTLTIIGKVIRNFNKAQRDLLIQCSLKYNASTRALLGIVFDMEKIKKGVDAITETLNPISTYNIGLKKIDRLLKEKWNIK